MSVSSKILGINEKLLEAGLKAKVSVVKTGAILNKKEGLHIVVNEIEESKFIDVSAQIQTILRQSLGYGTAKTDYMIDSKSIDMSYIPIPLSKVVSMRTSYAREQSHDPVIRKDTYGRVSTPGCTPLER